MRSRYVELDGPTHLAQFGGDGPPIVLVHGLGGSHVNWLPVGGPLSARHRVIAPDLVGHGRTPVADRDPSPDGHQRLLHRVLTDVVGEPAVLVGNSMGGLVSLLQAAREPATVSHLVLVGAAVPTPRFVRLDAEVVRNFALYAIPGVGERFLRWLERRMTVEERVDLTLDLCTVDASRIPDDVRRASYELARERTRMPWAADAFLSSARSLVPMLLKRTPIDDAIRRVAAPTLVVQGRQDRLVNIAAAHRLLEHRSDWTMHVLDDCGHVPQLEHPERFLDVLTGWLADVGTFSAAA